MRYGFIGSLSPLARSQAMTECPILRLGTILVVLETNSL